MDIFFYLTTSFCAVFVGAFTRSEKKLFNWCLFMFGCFCLVFIFSAFSSIKNRYPALYVLNLSPEYLIYFPRFLELGLDRLSYLFIGLTILIFYLSIYYSAHTVTYYIRFYIVNLLILFICLIIMFSTMNLFLFYFMFEVSLLPMFFLIGIWGTRTRRVRAAMFFFMYSVTFSMFFFFLLALLWYWFGSFNYYFLKYFVFGSYDILNTQKTIVIWICLFFTFAAKLPVIPFHLWLPEAHVEASTVGSVILASLLLKVGAFGLIKFLVPFFFTIKIYFLPLIYTLGIVSIVYATFMSIIQVDLKKIIAYSSIVHMNFGLLGLFTFSTYGENGSLLLFIGHGFVSAALFFLVGSLYERFGTRLLKYYSGLHVMMPSFSFFFLFFSFANIGFPGTVNFVSEYLIFCGIVLNNSISYLVFLGISFVSGLLYSIWLYNRIFYGTVTSYIRWENINLLTLDLQYFEKVILSVLAFNTIFFGIFPNFIIGKVLL